MIRIFVKDKELVLKRGTSLNVEINNALFAKADIEGDISFTFSLPVEGNEQAMLFAHLESAEMTAMEDCEIWCGGYQNWKGKLLVQKATKEEYQAALIINPYPEGFGKKSLTENEDTQKQICTSIDTHDTEWENFLKASVNDPNVKFAPFFNEEGYGSDNEDYGYWKGNKRLKIVNTLFFDPDDSLIDATGKLFSQAHNSLEKLNVEDGVDADGNTTYTERYESNQLAFCPQIRLAKIMDIWCRNAGYRFINHLGEDLNATFLQSQKSLDGTRAQYITAELPKLAAETTYYEFQTIGEGTFSGWYPALHSSDDASDAYVQNHRINIPATGLWEFETEVLYKQENTIWNTMAVVAITRGSQAFDDVMNETGALWTQHYRRVPDNGSWTDEGVYLYSDVFTTRLNIEQANMTGIKVAYYIYETKNNGTKKPIRPEGVQIKVRARQVTLNTHQTGFNIFRSQFRIPELLPDISNADFLKTMMETMGLCYFVSAKTKMAELVPYEAMRNAKSLDLTDYELTRETESQQEEETLRTFRLKPMKDEAYNEDLRMDDVEMTLPDAYRNHEHLVLRTKTNTLYRAETQEDAYANWTEQWAEHSGNPDKLKVGSGTEDMREPSVAIPHQRLFSMSRRHPDTDIATGEVPQLMVADFNISSDIYNPTDKPSQIILTQYRGLRRRSWEAATDHRTPANEVMLPVWADGFSLTAKGTNSLGEKYVKPVLELLGHRKVTYKFRIPHIMIPTVENLLRPSISKPERQTRFLIVRNTKTVPQRISFQIDNDQDDTVLCQIEAVKVY